MRSHALKSWILVGFSLSALIAGAPASAAQPCSEWIEPEDTSLLLFLRSQVVGGLIPTLPGDESMWLSTAENSCNANNEPVHGEWQAEGDDPRGIDTTTTWRFETPDRFTARRTWLSGATGALAVTVQPSVPDADATLRVSLSRMGAGERTAEIARAEETRAVTGSAPETFNLELAPVADAGLVDILRGERLNLTISFASNDQVGRSPRTVEIFPADSRVELPFSLVGTTGPETGGRAPADGSTGIEPGPAEGPAESTNSVGVASVLILIAAFVVARPRTRGFP